MKDLIVRNFTEFFTVYGMVLLFVLNIVLFHSQLLYLWEGYVKLSISMLKSVILMSAFLFAGILLFTCQIGARGKQGISEYADAHFFPMIAFILIEFAEFLMTIFDSFLDSFHQLNGKRIYSLSLEVQRREPIIRSFQSPALVLLQ